MRRVVRSNGPVSNVPVGQVPVSGVPVQQVQQVPVAAVPVQEQIVEEHVVASRRFDPAAVLAVLLGLALAVIGAVALARAGLEGPLDEPVVDVVGASHTSLLGLIEIGVGLLMIWAGLSRDRSAIIFLSLLFGAAALVAAIEPTVGGGALAIERGWAVALVVGFALTALVAALAPTLWRSRDRVVRL
jgi:hypothetical protein